jgi:hypothetical protein
MYCIGRWVRPQVQATHGGKQKIPAISILIKGKAVPVTDREDP